MLKKIKEFVWVRRIFVCVLAYLCVLSFNKLIMFHGEPQVYYGGKYFGYNLLPIVIFGVCIWLLNRYIKLEGRRLKLVSGVGGILLASAIVYGAYVHFVNDIFISTGEVFLQMGMVLAIGALCVPLMAEILLWIDRAGKWFVEEKEDKTEKKEIVFITKVKAFFRKHHWSYFLFVWLTIFLCHLPVFLAYWPGNIVFDSGYQLTNVITGWHTTHHPLAHTLMMGAAYEYGVSIGNTAVGYQLYTLAQMLILSSSFAYTMLFFYKKQVRTGVMVASWAFFALFPMNPLFGISATKDVLCAAFFLYFMVFLVRYIFDRENFKVPAYIGMILSGAFLALFRNNALYAVVLAGIIIVILIKGMKEKGKLLLVFIAIIALSKLINGGLIAYANAAEVDKYRESLCVPLQSLARVASYHADELDPALYEEICMYIPEDRITSYSPYLADQVKNYANETLLKTNTLNFFKLWVKVGLQFPDEYIESIVTNTMGYWYPLNQGHYVSADFAVYHILIGTGQEIEKANLCPWMSAIYTPLFHDMTYRQTPILGYLFRNAPYVWTCIILMLYAVYKKDKRLFMLGLLPIVYLLSCMCGPMAALRYIYCLVVCMPLLICTLLASGKKKIE